MSHRPEVLLVDNRDSFTHNLAELIRKVGGRRPRVISGDDLADLLSQDSAALDGYSHFVVSPGPGLPREFPGLTLLFHRYLGHRPLLGVCLGHQALAVHRGARLRHLSRPLHGEQRSLCLCGTGASLLFQGVEEGTPLGLYHSWHVDESSLPPGLAVTARSPEGVVMALEDRALNLYGVQFHPESFITIQGDRIMENFLCL